MIPTGLEPAILDGEVREALRTLSDESVHCVATSPPYWGLRDYGIPPVLWDGDPSCRHDWEALPPRGRRSPLDATDPASAQAGHPRANIELRTTGT